MKYVYKIVNILLALAIFLSAFFVNFVRVRVETSDKLADVIGSMSDEKTNGVAIQEDFSIKRAVDVYRGDDELSSLLTIGDGEFTWPEEFKPLNSRLIVFGASFALILLLAIVLIIISIVCGSVWPPLVIGVLGIAADIAMINSFRSAATLVYNNTVSITDYVVDQIVGSQLLNSLLGSAASSYVSFIFALCGLQNAFLFIFIAVVLWAVINFVVDIGDTEAEKQKAAAKSAKLEKKNKKKAKKAS